MPSDFALKTMNTVHRGLLKITRSKFGWTLAKMPALELTTVGRKSGKPRAVMLTSPVQLGDALVVVASKGGEDTHPEWFLNLRDNPSVEVSFKGAAKTPMAARVVDDAERDELWPKVVAAAKNYSGYQKKTTRKIPLVVLEPLNA